MTNRINVWDEISKDSGSRIKSRDWYQNKIAILKSRGLLSKNRLVKNEEMITSRLEVGSMYMYIYANPKFKMELPYWDAFPLTIVSSWDTTTFTGFNLHYLPPEVRWVLMKELMRNEQISTVRRLPKSTRLEMDYSTLKNASQFELMKPCIHKYLFERVGKLTGGLWLKVHPSDWLPAVLLPVADFRSKNSTYSQQKVWQDSLRNRI